MYIINDNKEALDKLSVVYEDPSELIDSIERIGKNTNEMSDMRSYYGNLSDSEKEYFKLKLSALGKPGIGAVRDYLFDQAISSNNQERIKFLINIDSDWQDNVLPIDRLIESAKNTEKPLIKSLCYRLAAKISGEGWCPDLTRVFVTGLVPLNGSGWWSAILGGQREIWGSMFPFRRERGFQR